MRTRSIAVGLLACLIAAGGGSVAATEPGDWVVLQMRIGAGGATDLRASVIGLAVSSGDDPALVGFGYADDVVRSVDIVPAGAGTARIATTSDAGSLELSTVSAGGPGRLEISSTLEIHGTLRPFTTLGILVFVTGMTFETVEVAGPTTEDGSTSALLRQGSGSRAIVAAGPEAAGLGGSAGPVAVAVDSTHERVIAEGIVGAFVGTGFCLSCSASWEAPHGAGGSFRHLAAGGAGASQGSATFAGPAGAWRWTWSGVGLTRGVGVSASPTLAAYAPIGEAWPLFEPFGA